MACNEKETSALFGISQVPQTDYITPLAFATAPKNYDQVVKEGFDFATYEQNTEDDEGFSTGSDLSEDQQIISHDVTQSFNERASSQLLARRVYAAFGNVTSVAVGAPVGATQHQLRLPNPSICTELPVYTYVEKTGEKILADIIHDVMFPSFMVETITISGDGTGTLRIETSWRGSGKRIGRDGTNDTPDFTLATGEVKLSSEQTHNRFRQTQGSIVFHDAKNLGNAIHTATCSFKAFSITLTNTLEVDDSYCAIYQDPTGTVDADSGAVRNGLALIKQEIEASATISIEKAFRPQNLQVANSDVSWENTYIGGAIGATDQFHTAAIRLNKAKISSTPITSRNGSLVFETSFKGLADNGVLPLEIDVITDISDLLAVV